MSFTTIHDILENAKEKYSFRPEFANMLTNVITNGTSHSRLQDMRRELVFFIELIDFIDGKIYDDSTYKNEQKSKQNYD